MKNEIDDLFGSTPQYLTDMTTKLNKEIDEFLNPSDPEPTTEPDLKPEKSLDEQIEEFLKIEL